MKKFIAIFLARQAAFWSKKLGKGGGGALPGLIAEKIYPQIISDLSLKIQNGLIYVTGTNGKTTTSKMISEILEASGHKVINNYGGSNLTRGLASILIEKSNFFGTKIKGDIGVYEVDEATLPQVTKLVKPRAIVVTNIFRDQLDRYGEVDKTAEIIKEGIKNSPKSTIFLNTDDPLVSTLAEENTTIYFGINDPRIKASSAMAVDSKDCLKCGTELNYTNRYFGHIGIYSCSGCGLTRKNPNIYAKNISQEEDAIKTEVAWQKQQIELNLPTVGLYNLYNALAAISVCLWLKKEPQIIKNCLEKFTPAFGRMERFVAESKEGVIHLIKNPTGFNQVIESISKNRKPKNILIILNDNFADGTDISWIWDVELEIIKNSFRKFLISGIRAEDLKIRLKYEGFDSKDIIVEKNITNAFTKALQETSQSEKLYILPTYTALLELRQHLVREGILREYWE